MKKPDAKPGLASLLRHVHTLATAAERLGAGDFSARTGLGNEPGEIGQLAGAFDRMAEAVERRYRRVQESDGPWPDLVLVDGGRGQLQAGLTALDRVGVDAGETGKD